MTDPDNPGLDHPTRIGPYTVVDVLGEGGMGIVYHVRQSEPVEREAALKVLKPGMDSRKVVTRFQAERQALAVMEHPSIAHVFDAGLTEDGRPYFVMELVRGIPLTRYCDEARLGLRERVRLFKQVCQAVQHAHTKGMIHRDLKPSNVLVTEQSGEAVPKVIDFGIARAVAEDGEETTRLTEEGHFIGTPAYMSPEQLLGESSAVDTRTDVYALGVLLYELLCGTLPFDESSYRGAAVYGMLQRDPPTPSARFSRMETAEEAAHYRRADIPQVRRELQGDLDWIVGKAMAREPERRYETVNGLAMELDRYLNQEPVLARPPSTRYRVGKFVRRNRGVVLAAAAAVVALVAGSVATTVGMLQAREAERVALESQAETEQVADFLLDVFTLSDPNVGAGDITARELLDSALVNVEEGLAEQPVMQGRMLLTMSKVYRNLALTDEAMGAAERSVEIFRAELGESSELGEALFEQGALLQEQARYDEAMAVLEESLAVRTRVDGPESHAVGVTLNVMGIIQDMRGDYEGAESTYRRVLEIQREAAGEVSHAVAQTATNLGAILQETQRFEAADSMYTLALEIWEELDGPDHPRVALGLQNLVTLDSRRLTIDDTTLARAERSLRIREKELGPDHPRYASSLLNMSVLYRDAGRIDETAELVDQAFRITRDHYGLEHPETAFMMEHVAAVQREREEWPEAEATLREAIRIYRATKGERHPDIAYAAGPLGFVLEQQERWEEAAQWFLLAAQLEEEFRGRWQGVMELTRYHANALRQLGREEEALAAEAKADSIEAELREKGELVGGG